MWSSLVVDFVIVVLAIDGGLHSLGEGTLQISLLALDGEILLKYSRQRGHRSRGSTIPTRLAAFAEVGQRGGNPSTFPDDDSDLMLGIVVVPFG